MMKTASVARRISARLGLPSIVVALLWPWGCAGPQRLPVAIWREDETTYLKYVENHASSPRDGFYAWKAATTGQTAYEVQVADMALSAKRNPFDAHKDHRAVSRGAVIYKFNCLSCHGEKADGRGPNIHHPQRTMDAHRFGQRFAATIHRGAPKAWFRKIAEGYTSKVANPDGGYNGMPPFAGALSREQLWLVITYLQSLDIHARPEGGSAE